MTEATNSQISMWRAAIYLAWADHEISSEEKQTLEEFFNKNFFLSPAQRTQLKADLDHKPNFEEVWKNITSKQDRAHLINIASVIFNSDGEYTELEKAAYEKILGDHMATLDVSTAMEITKMAETMRARLQLEESMLLNNMSRIARFVYVVEKMLLG